MDFGSVADKENANALMEQAQHLANKNVSMKVCSPSLGHRTSALQIPRGKWQEGNPICNLLEL